VVDEYVPAGEVRPARPADTAGPRVFPLSARSRDQLRDRAAQLADHLTRDPGVRLEDVAYTLGTGREAVRAGPGVVAARRPERAAPPTGVAAAAPPGPEPPLGTADEAVEPPRDGASPEERAAHWGRGGEVDWSPTWLGAPRRV